ncbi:MAG: universal stress protein [Gemmataceae bacterium]
MLPIKSILHPTDFSQQSEAAFALACSLAKDYDAELIVIHVAPPPEILHGAYFNAPPSPPEDLTVLKEQLFAVRPEDPAVRVEYFFLRGDPAEEILHAAEKNGCDLIVLGTHGRTGLGRLLMGSVAEHVLREAKCPVVTVKNPVFMETAEEEEKVSVRSPA